jgi:hypothetical protein
MTRVQASLSLPPLYLSLLFLFSLYVSWFNATTEVESYRNRRAHLQERSGVLIGVRR